jgi:hypothetical protein
LLDTIEFRQARQGRSVAGQPIGDDLLGRRTRMAEQTTEETFGGVCIPVFLYENINDLPVLIDSSPQVPLLPTDVHKHLVQMPGAPGAPLAPAQLVGERLPKTIDPAAHALVADLNASFCE